MTIWASWSGLWNDILAQLWWVWNDNLGDLRCLRNDIWAQLGCLWNDIWASWGVYGMTFGQVGVSTE